MISARETVIKLIKEHKPKTYIEVGCWKGELLAQVRSLGLDVLGIDPHQHNLNEFGDYHCRMGQNEVPQEELEAIVANLEKEFGPRYIRLTSLQAAEEVADESIDFVFIDAIHDYEHVKEDIQAWLPKVKKGGLLAGDDYKTRFPGLCQSVDELLPHRTIDGVVWYIKK